MTHVTATFRQESFRFRDDDGSETGATWLAAADTDITLENGSQFRIRFLIQETAGGSSNEAFVVRASYNGGAWFDPSSAVPTEVLDATSAYYANGDATTQQIGSGTFVAGDMIEGSSTGGSTSFNGNDETEYEWCGVLNPLGTSLTDGDTIDIRMEFGDDSTLDAYTVAYGRITVGSTAGLNATVNDGGTEGETVTVSLDHVRTVNDGGTEADDVTISGIPQNLTVEVNDGGTEADAVTVSGFNGQIGFRIRSDDTQTLNADAGWEAAFNTNVSLQPDRRFRIRFLVKPSTSFTDGFTLQRRINAGSWVNVPSNAHHFGPTLVTTSLVDAVPSGQYADLDATTQLIGSGTFVAGDGCETGTTGSVTFSGSNESEFEFCVVMHKIAETDAELFDGDTVEFRLTYDDGTPLEGYSQTPTVTVANRPGWLGTTVPEMGGDFGPFVDGNDNLYVVCERSEGDNTPTLMKSTDDGVSWTEVTRTGAPVRLDMEGCHAVQVGDTITIFHREGSDRVNAHQFRTSDHSTNPDTWGTVDDIVAAAAAVGTKVNSIDSVGAGWRASTSNFVVIVHGSNGGVGTTWALSGVVGSWGSLVELDTSHGADDMGGAQLVVGENDITHVFYINNTDGVLYHKTVAADTTVTATSLSPAQGTAGNTVATNLQSAVADAGAVYTPVYWMDAGVEKVAIGWHSSTAHMFVNVMHDGTWQGQQQASDNAVADDTADHQGAWSGLVVVNPALDDLRAYFIDNSDNSLLLEATNADPLTTFDTPTTFKDSSVEAGVDEARTGGTAGWDVIWGKSITHGGGTVFAFLGSWARGGTGLQYYEIAVGGFLTATPADGGTEADSATTAMDHVRTVADGGTEADADTVSLAQARSVADSGTAADTATAILGRNVTESESGAPTDSVTVSLDHVRTVADGGTEADARTVSLAQARSVADSGTAADAVTLTLGRNVTESESGAPTDSVAVVLDHVRAVTDSGTATDTATAFMAGDRVVTEADSGTATDTDTVALDHVRAITDSGTAADTATDILGAKVTVNDSGTAADDATLVVDHVTVIGDSGTASDSTAETWDRVVVVADTGSAADTISARIGLSVATADSGTATDAVTVSLDHVRAVTDTGTATDVDTASMAGDQVVTEADTGTATDTDTVASDHVRATSDSGTATDAVNAVVAANLISVTVNDDGIATDAVALTQDLVVTVTDDGTATDTATTTSVWFLDVTDDGTATDAVTATLGARITVADSGTAADAVSISWDRGIDEAETGTATDAVTWTAEWVRNVTDDGTATDTIVASIGRTMAVADVASGSDAVNTLVSELIGVAELESSYRDRAIMGTSQQGAVEIRSGWRGVVEHD